MRALVTAGTRGIGLAIAQKLSFDGHDVVVASRTKPDDLPWWLPWVKFDALKPDSVLEMLDQVGACQILVNNCGGGGRWGSQDVLATDPAVWGQVWQKNCATAIVATLAMLHGMVSARFGRVVSISSIQADYADGRPWFGMAKAGLRHFMTSMSQQREFVRAGVTFNTVTPGRIAVGGGKEDDLTAAALENHPMGRIGASTDVAAVVSFLCSPDARFVNGADIRVDGGECPAV